MDHAQATCTNIPIFLVIMAYSSNYVRVAPDRSRSRDDPPMWNQSNSSRTSNPQYRDSWHQYRPPRQSHRVLVIVNLEQIRPLMNSHHCDAMEATTVQALPSLGRLEEYALFTYSFLVHPAQAETLTVNIMLYYISQQPAHHTLLGLLLGTFFHGSSLARQYWRYFRSTQWSDPHRPKGKTKVSSTPVATLTIQINLTSCV